MSSILSRAAAVVPLAAILVLGGCMAKSFTPAVGKSDRVVDRGLVGSWRSDDNERVVIALQDSDYAVLYTDKDGKTAPLVGRLGRLGNRWILDVTPDESGMGKSSDAYKGLLVPVHTFLIVDSIGARMSVSGMKEDSLDKYLQREPAAVAHIQVDDNPVLTAPTAELRAFLERYVARPGVLDATVWTKQ